MAIEDEYELTFTNRQVREVDGWRMSHTQVRNVDEDSYYINDRQTTFPLVRPIVTCENWTPNSFDCYADSNYGDWRFRRFRYAPLS